MVVSILLFRCTIWTLTKRTGKKLDGNYTRMLRAIVNKSWRQHSTKQQLHGHLPPITKTIKIRLTRYAGHCWRRKDELISNELLWTPSHGRAKAGCPARTYIRNASRRAGRKQCAIGRGGERESGKSVLMKLLDDNGIHNLSTYFLHTHG